MLAVLEMNSVCSVLEGVLLDHVSCLNACAMVNISNYKA
jgi:hypothetical protein